MKLICVLLACAGLYAQSFPAAVYTPLVAKDNLTTKLIAPMTPTDTVAIVQSSTGWLPNMVASICESANSGVCVGGFEMLLVTNVAGNVLTVTRGYSGSTAVPHANGRTFVNSINSAYNSSLTGEVTAIESWASTMLGAGRSQVWLGPYDAASNSKPTRLAIATDSTFYNSGYFYASNAALGVSVGGSSPTSQEINGIQSFLNAGPSFGAGGYVYRGGFASHVTAQAGTNQWAPFGFFAETTSYSDFADPYGLFIIAECGSPNGCASNVGHGILATYITGKDYAGPGVHSTNITLAEYNLNNRATYNPGHYLDGWTAINIVRAPGGAGHVPGGTAVQAGANWFDDVTKASCVQPNCGDWARGFYYFTGHADGIAFEANYIHAGATGDWRIMTTPNLEFRTNTNAARDWSTYRSAFVIGADGTVYIGGDGGPGGAVTAIFAPNGGGMTFPPIKAISGSRTLCINSTGDVSSVAGPCPAGS